MKKGKRVLTILLVITLLMGLYTSTAMAAPAVTVKYSTHVQDIGWQADVSDGVMAGTTGQSKRLEGIKIWLEGTDSKINGIKYSTHIQDIGWQFLQFNGGMSGTSGQSKRLEAIQIELTGPISQSYDIYYRVHSQNFGWMGWAKNGESAGTAGYSYRLEGIEVKLVTKNGTPPGSTENQFRKNAQSAVVSYSTHVQEIGWQKFVENGQMAGTTGQSKRLEGIIINLKNTNSGAGGGIHYKTHIEDYGWEPYWKSDGQVSGTTGESKRLEAIQIRISEQVAKEYDIYYRVHCQEFGWMEWAKNGGSAGTTGFSYRLEGIEIVVVGKGGTAPGSSENAFRQNMSNLPPSPSPFPNPSEIDGVEIIPVGSTFCVAVFDRINSIKVETGYPLATWDNTLAASAQAWAETCARNKGIAHEGGLFTESIGNGYGSHEPGGVAELLTGHNYILVTDCLTIGVGAAYRADGFGGVYCVIRGRH